MKVVVLYSRAGNLASSVVAYLLKKPGIDVRAISDNFNPEGVARVLKAGVLTEYVKVEETDTYDWYSDRLAQMIGKCDLVVMAGFMRRLSYNFVNCYKVLNCHPSLLPKYPGLNTYVRALENNEQEHGFTVHWANHEYDAGKIVAQFPVPVLPNETVETLEAKTKELERELYPRVVYEVLNEHIDVAA